MTTSLTSSLTTSTSNASKKKPRRGGLVGSRGVKIAVRLAIVLLVASFAAAVHDALFDVVESMMVFFFSSSSSSFGWSDVNPNGLEPLCETKTLSIAREDAFKVKAGWRTECSETYAKQMQVASRFHFLRRRAEEAEGTSKKKKKSRKVYSNEGRGTPPPPIEKLRQLEAYAYAGNDFDIFDDTDKAVGRKAISILFTGRDGFINEQLARFRYCEIVVVTASFGAQDTLHRPVGADPSRYKQDNVCFVAFVDKPTIEKFGYQSGCFDVWNVVEYAHSGFSDSRMKARLVKALLPFHFPESKVTVWIDSKLELNKDATAVVDVLLRVNTHPKVTRVKRHEGPYEFDVAVSENHVRMDVFAEADKLTKMFHGALSVNETYDSDRSRWLSQTVKRYKEEGFQGKGLPDTGLFIRRTNAIGFELSARWAHEIVRSPFGRDQISFPYVKWIMEQRGFRDRIRVFEKCWYIAAVNEVGHASRSGTVV